MTVIQAAILGIVQGLTEFVPISSSAHLIIIPWLFGWDDPGLAFDVALHLGTRRRKAGFGWGHNQGSRRPLGRECGRPGELLQYKEGRGQGYPECGPQ